MIDPTTRRQSLDDFDLFFRREFPRLARSLGFALGDFDLGADLAQESFTRVYERWGRYEDERHARYAAATIGMNLARSHWRRARRARSLAPMLADEYRPTELDPSDRLTMERAIAGLSKRQRECTVLVDYLGFDSIEASKILRIPAGNVRTHLVRARRNLGAAIRDTSEEVDDER